MRRSPEEQVGYLLKSLQHLFRHALESRLRHSSVQLSFAHLVTLDQLHDSPGLPGAQLARRLLVTAQTMNEILKRLEKDGSIERHQHPENRRADLWELTTAGRRRLENARCAAGPVMTQMLSPLSQAEIAELQRFLGLCVEGLEGTASGTQTDQPSGASSLAMQRLKGESRYSQKRSMGVKPARR